MYCLLFFISSPHFYILYYLYKLILKVFVNYKHILLNCYICALISNEKKLHCKMATLHSVQSIFTVYTYRYIMNKIKLLKIDLTKGDISVNTVSKKLCEKSSERYVDCELTYNPLCNRRMFHTISSVYDNFKFHIYYYLGMSMITRINSRKGFDLSLSVICYWNVILKILTTIKKDYLKE